mmetsp:Transcript_22805/g.34536  ORF Transcript_22805/g.34536 Transcript_22805/m.34536 type:complete len:91 (-) Transcript_22805:212-484(-)
MKGIGNLQGPTTTGGVTFAQQPGSGTPALSSSGLWLGVGSSGASNQQSTGAATGGQTMLSGIAMLETDLQKVKDKVEGCKVEVSGVSFST